MRRQQNLWFIFTLLLVCPVLAMASPPTWHSVMALGRDETLSSPASLTIDSVRKRYYVVDYGGNQLVSFSEDGQLIDRFDAAGALEKPVSMAFGAKGKLWVAQRSSNELLYIDLNTRNIRRFNLDETTGTSVFLDKVMTDVRNRLYVVNSADGRILRLDDNLHVDTIFSAREDSRLVDLKIKDETLYTLDETHNQVLCYSLDGKLKSSTTLNGKLSHAVSFDIDEKGSVYVADRAMARIAVYSSTGTFKYDFSRQGARRGQLHYPGEIVSTGMTACVWSIRGMIVLRSSDHNDVFY